MVYIVCIIQHEMFKNAMLQSHTAANNSTSAANYFGCSILCLLSQPAADKAAAADQHSTLTSSISYHGKEPLGRGWPPPGTRQSSRYRPSTPPLDDEGQMEKGEWGEYHQNQPVQQWGSNERMLQKVPPQTHCYTHQHTHSTQIHFSVISLSSHSCSPDFSSFSSTKVHLPFSSNFRLCPFLIISSPSYGTCPPSLSSTVSGTA